MLTATKANAVVFLDNKRLAQSMAKGKYIYGEGYAYGLIERLDPAANLLVDASSYALKSQYFGDFTNYNKNAGGILGTKRPRLFEVDERAYYYRVMRPRKYTATLAAAIPAQTGLSAANPTPVTVTFSSSIAQFTDVTVDPNVTTDINDVQALQIRKNSVLTFPVNGLTYQAFVTNIVDQTAGTAQVIFAFSTPEGELLDIPAIPAGTEVLVGDTHLAECGGCDVDNCAVVRIPCLKLGYIQQTIECIKVCKADLFARLNPILYPADKQAGLLARMLERELWHKFYNNWINSFYFGESGIVENNGQKFYISGGLVEAAQEGQFRHFSGLCYESFTDYLSDFAEEMDVDENFGYTPGNVAIIMATRQFVKFISAWLRYNKQVVVTEDAAWRDTSKENIYQTLTERKVAAFKINGVTFVVLESPKLTQFYPFWFFIFRRNQYYEGTLAQRSITLNGREVTYGGFWQKVSQNPEDITCPETPFFDRLINNYGHHWVAENSIYSGVVADIDACTFAIVNDNANLNPKQYHT
jgi:hypothetical protein